MKKGISITVLAALCSGLVGWAALAWAQPALTSTPAGGTSAKPPAPPPGSVSLPVGPTEAGLAPPSAPPTTALPLVPPPAVPPAPLPPAEKPVGTLPPMADKSVGTPLPMVEKTAGAKVGPFMNLESPLPLPSPPVVPPVTPSASVAPMTVPASSIPPLAPPAPPTATGEEPVPTVTNDNPTGRQEPAISLEWNGPPTAKIGTGTDYGVVVRNACNSPVQQVTVRVKLPSRMTAVSTEPKAVVEGDLLTWELGTLPSKQEKVLQMKLLSEVRGDVMPQAWVTFTGSSVLRIRVLEPKLVLKATAPEKVMIGDAAAFLLTVTNPGDGPAEGVQIHALLSEGLEHAKGNKVEFEVGNLAPGETRAVQLICGTKAGGPQSCDGVAEAEGGLKSEDHAGVNVLTPRLELKVVGPALRYLDRKAVYTLTISNPGDASATNVTINDVIPPGFKFLAASDGGRNDFATRTVSWFLGELAPGQNREVKVEVQAVNPGEHLHKATAIAARGLKVDTEWQTTVKGLSAILLEVVDTEDPIEVGGDTAYEIRVTNTGSATETDLRLVCNVPDKMEFKRAEGPVRYHEEGNTISFDPLPKLAPRADAIFRLHVKALRPGDVRFKTQITSTNLVEPVVEMEATRIYADAPEAK